MVGDIGTMAEGLGDSLVAPHGHEAAQGLMDALAAAGMDVVDALVHVFIACGSDVAKPFFLGQFAPDTPSRTIRLLDAVAMTDPVAADAWLREAFVAGLIRSWWAGSGMGSAVHLGGRPWITRLPGGCPPKTYAAGIFDDCAGLVDVGEGVVVDGDLSMRRCVNLTTLKLGFRVTGSLHLEGCTSLVSLPEGMSVGGDLHLNGCVALKSIPVGLKVGGHLHLTGCPNLEVMPGGLKVGGDLHLSDSEGFRRIPEAVQVGGALAIYNCPNWDGRFPRDLRVGYKVFSDVHQGGIPLKALRAQVVSQAGRA